MPEQRQHQQGDDFVSLWRELTHQVCEAASGHLCASECLEDVESKTDETTQRKINIWSPETLSIISTLYLTLALMVDVTMDDSKTPGSVMIKT